MKKILYIVSNPFSYSRSPVGGNISSASGVIMGFVQQGYYVDVVTDSLIPSIDKENDKLKSNILSSSNPSNDDTNIL